MNLYIGLETKPYLKEIPDFLEFFLTEYPPMNNYGSLYIFEPGSRAEDAADPLKEAELLEEKHALILAAAGESMGDFCDYGFSVNDSTFLYRDEISAFSFTGGEPVQIEMALLQLEEHLIYTATNRIYFSPRHYNELIQGIVKAYRVEVEFLDLDK